MKKLILLLLCLCYIVSSSYCANTERMCNLTTKDGLFSDRFFKTFRDNKGYLWMLGINGVAFYDGKHITNFEPTNTHSLQFIKGTRFYTINQDINQNIWIGGNAGLNLYNVSKNTFVPIPIKSTDTKEIKLIDNYNDSTIWVSYTNRENYLININNHQYKKQDQNWLLTQCTQDNNGNKYLVTRSKMIIKNYEDTVLHAPSGINDICFTPSGKVYIATFNGMYVLNKSDLDSDNPILLNATNKIWLSNRTVTTVAYYNGNIWAGTNNGLNKCILDKNEYPISIEDYYSDPESQYSLTNNLIIDLHCDKEGILWIATYGGINKIDPSQKWFNSFRYDPDEDNTIHDNYIFTISGDRQGNIWMGNYTSGVSQYNVPTNTFKWYNANNSLLKNNHIRQIYSDLDGETWISTSQNLCIYRNNTLYPVTFTGINKKLQGKIYSIIQHPDEYYWIGNQNYIYKVKKIDIDRFKVIKEIFLDKAKDIIRFYIDEYLRVWVGTSGGVFLIDSNNNDDITVFKKKNNALSKSSGFQAINADSFGNIWIGSIKGVFVAKNDSNFKNHPEKITFDSYYKEDGLASDYVSGILPGKNGEMWLASWKGIMKYNPKGIGISKFTPYSFSDGLVSEKYNRNGYFLDPITNTYYFGSANGVNYFKIEDKTDKRLPSKVRVHKIEVDGKITSNFCTDDSICDAIKVLGSIKQLAVSLGSSSLLSPDKQVFAWKLEGKHTEWNFTRNRKLIIKGLSAGNYNLIVKTVSSTSGLGPSLYIPIKVNSIIYRILLSISLLLLISGLIYTIYRSNQLKKKKEKYVFSKLSTDKSSEIINQLNSLMTEQKPYVNPNLTVNQLADLVGITSGKLSQVLNDFLQTRFYEYVNKYRVDEFVKCLENKENETMTLQALSEKCGFASKSSFYRFFKDQKGTTPAQYAKNLSSK